MPKSLKSMASYHSVAESDDEDYETRQQPRHPSDTSRTPATQPTTPTVVRKHGIARTSELDLRSRMPTRLPLDEHMSLLAHADDQRSYRSVPASTPATPKLPRLHSSTSIRRNHSRHGSFGLRLARALGNEQANSEGPAACHFPEHPVADRPM